jgi:hypothetical protein
MYESLFPKEALMSRTIPVAADLVILSLAIYVVCSVDAIAQNARYKYLSQSGTIGSRHGRIYQLFKLDQFTGELWACSFNVGAKPPTNSCRQLTGPVDKSSDSLEFDMTISFPGSSTSPTIITRYNMKNGDAVLCLWDRNCIEPK